MVVSELFHAPQSLFVNYPMVLINLLRVDYNMLCYKCGLFGNDVGISHVYINSFLLKFP